jgi:hypothetical protein
MLRPNMARSREPSTLSTHCSSWRLSGEVCRQEEVKLGDLQMALHPGGPGLHHPCLSHPGQCSQSTQPALVSCPGPPPRRTQRL